MPPGRKGPSTRNHTACWDPWWLMKEQQYQSGRLRPASQEALMVMTTRTWGGAFITKDGHRWTLGGICGQGMRGSRLRPKLPRALHLVQPYHQHQPGGIYGVIDRYIPTVGSDLMQTGGLTGMFHFGYFSACMHTNNILRQKDCSQLIFSRMEQSSIIWSPKYSVFSAIPMFFCLSRRSIQIAN